MALTDSLVSYWKLDEASGDALDAHGSSTLTDTNTVTSTTGKIGTARQFTSASTEYFTAADSAALSTGDIDFTFSLWVYFDTIGGGIVDIVSKWDNASNLEYLIGYSNATNRLRIVVRDTANTANTARNADTLGIPSATTWYHIVAWHDSANNELGISVNGGAADTVSYSSGVRDAAAPFRLGARGDATSLLNGRLDEVGFWKRVLTSGERSQLYNSGSGLAYSSFATSPIGKKLIVNQAFPGSFF